MTTTSMLSRRNYVKPSSFVSNNRIFPTAVSIDSDILEDGIDFAATLDTISKT